MYLFKKIILLFSLMLLIQPISFKVYAQAFVVVIDPGHGGVDTGALADNNVMEKEITLRMARLIKEQLEQLAKTRNFQLQVFLTRNIDAYVSLHDRVETATNLAANLLLSIHADSIKDPALRGATIYTGSHIASDRLSEYLATDANSLEKEKSQVKDSNTVQSILGKLKLNETIKASHRFSQILFNTLKGKIVLMSNPQRAANFVILESNNFPSALLELGYLSNALDVKALTDDTWLLNTAKLIATAIVNFAQTSE